MTRDNLAEFLQYVGGLENTTSNMTLSQIGEIAETWKNSQNRNSTTSTRKQVQKSYSREFKLQTLTLLQTGRMQREGKWVKISKRGKPFSNYSI